MKNDDDVAMPAATATTTSIMNVLGAVTSQPYQTVKDYGLWQRVTRNCRRTHSQAHSEKLTSCTAKKTILFAQIETMFNQME